jgi:hypothetical protein
LRFSSEVCAEKACKQLTALAGVMLDSHAATWLLSGEPMTADALN